MLSFNHHRAIELETQLASMAFKQKNYVEDIELLKSHQVQQHDLQSKLRMSEKTRLELLSSLCQSESNIKKLKIDLMRLQENQKNRDMHERQIVEENDRMWSSRLASLQKNFENDKQLLQLKLEKRTTNELRKRKIESIDASQQH